MKVNGHGNTLYRGLTFSVLITIVVMLMAQSKAQGKIEEKAVVNSDRNTLLEERQEKYDDNFTQFMISQTALNTTLSNFVEQQIEANKEQKELNEEFKEHIIRGEN